MTMMELRVTGKRTAVGAHRGQAVLFVFHAGASKPRDVYVWDADKGKPACMLRGLGEEEWKQYVRAERPFPTSPCGYLGFDEKPRHQRGFGSRLAHNGQQQTQDGGRGQQKTGRQDASSRPGVQGSQLDLGSGGRRVVHGLGKMRAKVIGGRGSTWPSSARGLLPPPSVSPTCDKAGPPAGLPAEDCRTSIGFR